MSEVALTIKNATADTKSLGTILASSLQYPGHYNKAVIEGGATPYVNLDVDETGVVVKSSAGQLYGGLVFNLHGATPSGLPTIYLKIYDKATAPTSSDTPKFTIPIEAGEPVSLGGLLGVTGVAFANGIGLRCTHGLANNDTTALVMNNACVVNLSYA
jgi:hypothetical protein